MIRRLLRIDPYGNLFRYRTRARLRKLLSPGWIVRRIEASAWALRNPEAPWLARQALSELESWLRPAHQAFEWGSGLSTPWIAKRVGRLTAVEHDAGWQRKVQAMLDKQGVKNAEVRLVPEAQYAQSIEEVAGASLDLVLIDGIYAGAAVGASLSKVRPSGLLVVNRAQTLLPSDSARPDARGRGDGPHESVDPLTFVELQRWTARWVTDGLDDVAFFWKP